MPTVREQGTLCHCVLLYIYIKVVQMFKLLKITLITAIFVRLFVPLLSSAAHCPRNQFPIEHLKIHQHHNYNTSAHDANRD